MGEQSDSSSSIWRNRRLRCFLSGVVGGRAIQWVLCSRIGAIVLTLRGGCLVSPWLRASCPSCSDCGYETPRYADGRDFAIAMGYVCRCMLVIASCASGSER